MKKGTLLGDAVILFIITLAAGVLLGGANEITKGPIATAKEKAKQEAYLEVFPEAKSFEANEELNGNLETEKVYAKDTSVTGVFINEVLEAKDASGNSLGYVMSIGSKEGYGGEIGISLGVDLTGTVTGMKVLSSSETAGLGAKCQEDVFQSQFAGIQSDEITYTKTGKSADNEIDALSGATITTKAVTKAINNALGFIYSYGNVNGTAE